MRGVAREVGPGLAVVAPPSCPPPGPNPPLPGGRDPSFGGWKGCGSSLRPRTPVIGAFAVKFSPDEGLFQTLRAASGHQRGLRAGQRPLRDRKKLRSRYLLAYPSDQDIGREGFRKIEVRVE